MNLRLQIMHSGNANVFIVLSKKKTILKIKKKIQEGLSK